ncbi:glutaredoxin [Motiliproteus sp. SC1-56]|uniref:glutaredoxin family protein n=1 Tax=Motiliproteus sp. SC1-56 TaxID=2799565 RepID=UPI001A9093B8|nr:glutaredoxin [Motiliproteus sp. SC1-56]
MKIVRWLLGRLILLLNFLTPPRRTRRPAEVQEKIDQQTQALALYQYPACPFCVKVRRALRRHSLNVELRDAKREPEHREALVAGGGRLKVPCLQIQEPNGEVRWLYESGDIVRYLEGRFVQA